MIVASLAQHPFPNLSGIRARHLLCRGGARPSRPLLPIAPRHPYAPCALCACHPGPISPCPVLPTPPKSPAPRTLPLHKIRPLPAHSKSTLLQLLIPLDLNSFRRNGYKKPGESPLPPAPKFVNSSLANRCSCGPHTNARKFFPLMRLLHTSLYPPGWVFTRCRRLLGYPRAWIPGRQTQFVTILSGTCLPAALFFYTACGSGIWLSRAKQSQRPKARRCAPQHSGRRMWRVPKIST